MVKLEVPAVAGVPPITPVEEFSDSCAGKAPWTIDQAYGGVPPTAWSGCEYATPTVALGSDGAVVMISPLAMVMVNCLETGGVDALSPSWMVKVKVPAAVGIPEMTPLTPLSPRPFGKAPPVTDHTYGGTPPVPASVWLYVTPMVPLFNVEFVVITSGVTFTGSVKGAVAVVPLLSLTVTLKFTGPGPGGVPAKRPAVLRLSHAGKPVADQV